MLAYNWNGQLQWYNKTCEIDSNRISSAFLQKNLLNGNQLLFVGNGGGSIGAITLLELEYNGQFDKVLVHDFNENDYLSVQSTLENSQNIFVVGNKALNNSLWNSKAFLLATNKELEFDQYFEVNKLPSHSLFKSVIEDYDDNLLIGAIEHYDDPVFDDNILYNHILYKYNPDVNDTIESMKNPFSEESIVPYGPEFDLYKYQNGLLALEQIHTYRYDMPFGANDKYNYYIHCYTHTDVNFNIQWQYCINDSMNYGFKDPIFLENGDWVIGGVMGSGFYRPSPFGSDIIWGLHFAKLNAAGELIWKKEYAFLLNSGYNERDVFSIEIANFFQHPQGGYLLFGSIRTENNEGETGQDVLWAWIDEEGCIQNDICAEPFQWLYTPEPNDPGMQAYYTSNVIPLQPYYDFKLFPNPAKDQLNIQLPQLGSIQAINIYNSSGTLVFSKKQLLNENLIDIQQWENGIYLVNVLQNGRSFTKKFVKE